MLKGVIGIVDRDSERSRQQGFSMVEILVAVVILGVGLLGLAGLQTASLKNNDDAYLRSQATILAYSMLDHMRANYAATANDDYDIDFSDSAPSQNCIASGCNYAQLAKSDLEQWLGQLSQVLPKGDGKIETQLNGIKVKAVVTIRWHSNVGTDAGTDDTQTVVLSSAI